MIYFVIFLFLLILAYRLDFKLWTSSSKYIYIVFGVLVLLAGFRYRVGTDTLIYMDEYTSDFPIIKEKYLIGWSLLMSFFHDYNFSFYVVQLIIALVINWGVVSFLKNYFPHFVLTGLLIYYTILYPAWNFEVLRQALCISLFFISLPYLDKKQYIKYYLLIAIACTIHEVSLFLLFLPLLMRIPLNKESLSIFALLTIILISIAPSVRNYIVQYALVLAPFQDKAEHYFREVEADGVYNIFNYLFNIILNVGIPMVVIWRYYRKNWIDMTIVRLSLVSFITYSCSLMLPMLYRLNYFFVLPSLMLFVYLFKVIADKTKNTRLIFFALLLVFIGFKTRIYFTQRNGIPTYIHYYPYHSILDEEKEPLRELNFTN